MKLSVKHIVENPKTWIITQIIQGYRGMIRVDARTRYYQSDSINWFSGWVSEKYFNRLRFNLGKCRAKEMNQYEY